jgi:hypothetical protein
VGRPADPVDELSPKIRDAALGDGVVSAVAGAGLRGDKGGDSQDHLLHLERFDSLAQLSEIGVQRSSLCLSEREGDYSDGVA